MKEKYKLNNGHIIEAADRVHLIQSFLESALLEHPLIDAVPDFSKKANIAQDILGDLYQEIAIYDSLTRIASQHKVNSQYEI